MNGERKRQLPSWMLRPSAVDQASISATTEGNKENGLQEPDTKACEPQKNVQKKQRDTKVPLLENMSHSLKKCEARRVKRKLSKPEIEDQGDEIDCNDVDKKVDVKVGKRSRLGNEQHFLKKCSTNGRKRMSNKQDDDLCESDLEKRTDVVETKRFQGNASRTKQKEKRFTGKSPDVTVESVPNEDELTVEDLISIAEEYVNAGEELGGSQDVKFESETKPPLTTVSRIQSEKDLAACVEDRLSVTDKPLSTESPLVEPFPSEGRIFNPTDKPQSAKSPSIEPLRSEGSITTPSYTCDAGREMLNLLLGPFSKNI